MTYLILDKETTTAIVAKRKASPFDGVNWCVANGWKEQGHEIEGVYFKSRDEYRAIPIGPDVTILVGHNIKFDLLWMWNEPDLIRFIERGGKVWDTQYAEYLIQGQIQKYHMNAMSDIAEKYGGNKKIDAVKAMWDEGIDTPDIPQDLLMRYLLGGTDPDTGCVEHGDIGNTESIFLGQVRKAKEQGQVKMIQSRMEGLLATTEMEYNGLKVNQERGNADQQRLSNELSELSDELDEYIPADFPTDFKWTSPVHKSALIFGGKVKYQRWVQNTGADGELLFAMQTQKWPLFGKRQVPPDDPRLTNTGTDDEPFYVHTASGTQQDVIAGGKSKGMPKFKNVKVPDLDKPKGAKQDFWYEMPGFTKPNPQWQGAKPGVYSTAAGVIELLGNRNVPFLKTMARRAKIDKDLGTYYWSEDAKGNRKGMLTLVNDSGYIHHGLNHTSTVTGRLSSSNPNMQNIPRGDKSVAKAMFISRFENGQLGEVDYSQLEVVIQGVLTGDVQLTSDLCNRIDFHCKRLAAKLGEVYEDVLRKAKQESDPEYASYSVQRTGAKNFSFQRAYGAGAAAIVDSTGMSLDDVEALIETEERLYPGVVAFNEGVAKTVKASRWSCRDFQENPHGPGVVQCGKGEWWSPTGTRYVWSEHPAPKFLQAKGIMATFSPPELKNYPPQGFGGEVVQVMLGKLFRRYVAHGWWSGNPDPDALLTNTVHDCVWNDMKPEVVGDVLKLTIDILQSVPETFNAMYSDLNITVPFPVDAEVGDNMLDLSHFGV